MTVSEIDIARIRKETPGVKHVCHLLASGSALMPQPVIDAITDHTLLEARIGGYEAAAQQHDVLEAVYEKTAGFIGAKAHEIALVENATVAWQHAFYALPLKAGDRVLTCEAEYAANYVAFLQRHKREGVIIDVVPSDENGSLDTDALENMIDDRVRLIAITWVPTNGGLVNPASRVGEIAGQYGITYLLDACQAAGQMPIDVQVLGCDFLSATSRKFLRGPRGSGFLYASERMLRNLEPVMIDHFGAPWIARDEYRLREDARRFETWENSYALRAGLGAAIDYADNVGMEAIQLRCLYLSDYLRDALSLVPDTRLRDIGAEQCAIVSFSIDGMAPRETVAALRKDSIMIGASSPSSTRIDSERRNLPDLFRIAPHYYNTTEEIDRVIAALKAVQVAQ